MFFEDQSVLVLVFCCFRSFDAYVLLVVLCLVLTRRPGNTRLWNHLLPVECNCNLHSLSHSSPNITKSPAFQCSHTFNSFCGSLVGADNGIKSRPLIGDHIDVTAMSWMTSRHLPKSQIITLAIIRGKNRYTDFLCICNAL